MHSKSDGIVLLIFFALIVFCIFLLACRAANYFLNRDIKYLVLSTSFIGTFTFFLALFVIPMGLRQIEQRWYEPHTYMPLDFTVKADLILSPVAAGFCMVTWQVLFHLRRNKTQ